MYRFTTSRRRLATLASTAIAAGALTALPAVAGLSPASAAPVSLGYTCELVFGGNTYEYDSTLDVEVTAPATVEAGESFDADIAMTLDMGSHTMGPVTSLSGSVDLDLDVGGTTQTVNVPVSTATLPAATFTGTKTAALTAPASAGAADIDAGSATAQLTAAPFGMAVSIPCVPDDGQDQTVASTTVTAPAPEGAAYDCAYGTGSYAGTLDLDVDAPATVTQGDEVNPAVSASFAWSDAAAGTFRTIALTPQADTSVLHLGTSTAGTAGTADIAMPAASVPASGDVVWTGTGSWGAIDTSTVGDVPLSIGNSSITMQASVSFSHGAYLPVTFTCAPAAGADTAVGSVEIEKKAGPVAVPVTGKAKVTGTAKVGKTLKAVPGKAVGAKVSYQWLSNGKAIKKATKATLKLTKSLKGKKVSAKVTYAKAGYKTVVQTTKALTVKK